MSKERNEIGKVRNNIASIIHNDCLPTELVTNTLKEICFQYDKFISADREFQRQDALKAIKLNMEFINKHSLSTGMSHKIFQLDNSLERVQDLGETVAIIYALPYKSGANVDYVGYAYGTIKFEMDEQRWYGSYMPDEYLNKCNQAVMQLTERNDAIKIWNMFASGIVIAERLRGLEMGTMKGDINETMLALTIKITDIDNEMEKLGVSIEHRKGVSHAEFVMNCMASNLKYAKRDAIENVRSNGEKHFI